MNETPTAIELAETVEVAPGAYAYVQPNGTWFINNTGFIVGDDGVILIDTCSTEARTRAMLDAVRAVSDAPIRTVVNTHHHGDHTHGNYLTAPAPIVAHQRCRELVAGLGIDHYPTAFEQPDWGDLELAPPTMTFDDRLDLWVGGRAVELHHIGPIAHTTNDVVAWLPDDRVLYTGDLVFHQGTPFVLMGSVDGSLASLDTMREMDPAVVVPGHGPVCGVEVFDEIERYLRFVRSTAEHALANGLTPLDAARDTDLGEFASLTDPERIVGNLHRCMADLQGPDTEMSIVAAIGDMITYSGKPLLPCSA